METTITAAADTTTKPILYTGLPVFDQYYANRARPGDAWLITGTPAAGKTSFACQMAAESAEAGSRVLLITAENKRGDLLVRCFSPAAGVSVDEVRERVLTASEDRALQDQLRGWVMRISKKLQTADLPGSLDSELSRRVTAAVHNYTRAVGAPPEIIILDSLTPAVVGGRTPGEIAQAMDKGASEMVQLARHGYVTVTFARGCNGTDASGIITEQDTAYSKSLGDGMTTVVGITNLSGKCLQALAVVKSREEVCGRVRVSRDFAYSRFQESPAMCWLMANANRPPGADDRLNKLYADHLPAEKKMGILLAVLGQSFVGYAGMHADTAEDVEAVQVAALELDYLKSEGFDVHVPMAD